jgi:hypothetical protein
LSVVWQFLGPLVSDEVAPSCISAMILQTYSRVRSIRTVDMDVVRGNPTFWGWARTRIPDENNCASLIFDAASVCSEHFSL